MYRKVMLAYDGSREGRAALREGALLARRLGAEVVLLAIIPAVTSADAMGAPMVLPDEHEVILQEGLTKAREFGLSVSGKVVRGEPVEEIKAWADKLGVDLVVVGHRKRSLLERWWSGPSHAFLSDHLECSLLISRNSIEEDDLRAELDKAAAAEKNPALED
jgi:nucleotide-binding universal stress UspA family protein